VKIRGNSRSMMHGIAGVSLKSDLNTIEAPIFSLQKKVDTERFMWSKGNLKLVVTPGRHGRATIWDKDIVLYLLGQVAAEFNREGSPSRTIRTTEHDILMASRRGRGGSSYKRLEDALRRLRNTSIETNMQVGDFVEVREFSLIQEWRVIKSSVTNKAVCIEITLSEWLYKSVVSMNLITYDEEYFRITSGLERRLYEIFRRHLGRSSTWKIGEKKLFHKVGGRGSIWKFRHNLKAFEGRITGFRFYYDSSRKMIHVYPGSLKSKV